jgi:hypothetical protein
MGTANVEQVLQNLAAQSGLEVTIETRPTEVVVVTERTGNAALRDRGQPIGRERR